VNPAVGGSKPYYDVRSNHRYQWVGITDAPRTFTLSVHGPNKNRNVGLGGYVYTDIVGPTRRSGAQFSYSYHFELNDDDLKLSLALSGGLLHFQIDAQKITFKEENDPVVKNNLYSTILPDAKFGAYLYKRDKYYVGFSAPQLLQNKLSMFESTNAPYSRLQDHYFLHGGYRFEIADDWDVEPFSILKYVHPTPLKVDLNFRVLYQDQVWLGGGYRTNDAFTASFGFIYKKHLLFGYSHDFTTTLLRNHSKGTHEVVLGLRFNKKGIDEPTPFYE
jgi:type IX secretion system PorP/SprF family membrane protein